MSSLLLFPIEILALIFNRSASSQHVITLWKCGSQELNRRLVKCITNITLVDRRVTSSSLYPKLLSCFTNLRTLTIDRGNGFLTGSSQLIFKELHKLPLEMTSISIFAQDAPGCLNQADGAPYDWSTVFPELLTLNIEFYSSNRLKTMSKLPPKLENFTYSSLSYFNEETAAELPKSLANVNSRPTMHYDPPINHPRAEQANLPFAIVYMDEDFAVIPTNLKRMSASAVQHDDGVPIFDAEWIEYLPPTLESFYLYNVGYFTPSAISRLPRTFQSLIGETAMHWPGFAELERDHGLSKVLQVWPPTLTHLDCFRTFCTSTDLRYLPATLTSLSVTTATGLDFQELNTPNLRCLKIFDDHHSIYQGDRGTSCYLNWPSTLETLHLDLQAVQREDEIWLRSHLPESLRTLIYRSSYYDDDEFEEPVPLPPPVLPVGLVNLEVQFFDAGWLSVLPDTLETLAIVCTLLQNLHPDTWRKLPSNLQHFYVGYSFYSEKTTLSDRSFVDLPHLHTLTLPKSTSCLFSPMVFDFLPPSLTNLTIALEDYADIVASPPTGFEYLELHCEDLEPKLAENLSLNTQTTFKKHDARQIWEGRFEALKNSIKFPASAGAQTKGQAL